MRISMRSANLGLLSQSSGRGIAIAETSGSPETHDMRDASRKNPTERPGGKRALSGCELHLEAMAARRRHLQLCADTAAKCTTLG
jgi:hypothetical protein